MRTSFRATSLRATAVAAALLAVSPRLPLAPILHAQARSQDHAASPRDRVDGDVLWRIRREAVDKSQVMRTVQVLADLYGPRLTGSPNLRRAQDWIVQQATTWGLKNAHLEEWDFGHPGWQNERTSVHLVSPVKDTLVVEALAWTPSTPGTITAAPVVVEPPLRPTQADLDKFFDEWKGKLKGRAVMMGQPNKVDVAFEVPAKRRDDGEMRSRFSVDDPPAGPGQPSPAAAASPTAAPPAPVRPTADQAAEQLNLFLVKEGAALRVNDAGRTHGQIRAFNNRTFDVAKAVPTIVMRNEDYGRISRLLAAGQTVSIEATVVNQTYPEGRTQHNVIAEIPGSDKAREVVMLGGHLDSWHAATGATDNAVGVAVMLEVMRILRAIDVKPRRTIRVALWSGEEQGLRGSTAYVAQHFGSYENPKPEFDLFAGYFNLDTGTGRARGMTIFGPPAAARALRSILLPLQDTGVMGATATRSRVRAGSDHTSFNEAGLPGIGVYQDPIEYNSHSWHTNLDTYERIIESDTQQAAMAIAAAVYHVAMRDEPLPRFTKDEMPTKPGAAPRTTAP
jgi:carboxypeptidase Q